MTQLTFDFTASIDLSCRSTTSLAPSTVTPSTVAASNDRSATFHGRCSQAHSEVDRNCPRSPSSSLASESRTTNENRSAGFTPTSQSLSLHDGRCTELKHIGDLAQAVLARYDIVRQRRELRLRREAMRRAAIRSERSNPALIAH